MEIVLQSTRPEKYESGDVVSGVLRVPTGAPLKASDVTIALIGVTEVKWIPENVYGMYGIAPPLALHETVECLQLVHKVTDKDIKNEQGHHEIPFQFDLPKEGIPSTFKSPDGAITYQVIAVVKKSENKEERIEKEIGVIAPIRHKLTTPVISTVDKDFGVLSLVHGKVILHAALVRKGHYPGETIVLHCDVANDSTAEVTPRATLQQMKIYLFGERHRGSQKHITEHVVGKKIDKHSKGTELLAIPIPENIPLTIKTELISIKYFIHVTLDIPHAVDLHVNLPIIISTKSALNIHE